MRRTYNVERITGKNNSLRLTVIRNTNPAIRKPEVSCG